MRICFVQFGDFRDAVQTLSAGGGEAYYAQRYSVDFVADLGQTAEAVSVVSVASPSYEETLPNGVLAMGMPLWRGATEADLNAAVARLAPSHLIVRFPHRPLLRWGVANGVRTLPLLADSFNGQTLRERWQHRRLARVLNRPEIEWVANHNLGASRAVAAIGVDPAKILPWDWPPAVRPDDFPAKAAPESGRPFRLIYVGHLTEAKGLGDCIGAVRQLQTQGIPVSLTVVGGQGKREDFEARVRETGLGECVHFLGAVPHQQVVPLMREHDAVVVASRPAYPEGLPMTIYEALCSRTPLVISDHPMFRDRIVHEEGGLVFTAGVPDALAEQVRRLATSPDLYARLSERSAAAWSAIQCPLTWGDLLTRWLRHSSEDQRWLQEHALFPVSRR